MDERKKDKSTEEQEKKLTTRQIKARNAQTASDLASRTATQARSNQAPRQSSKKETPKKKKSLASTFADLAPLIIGAVTGSSQGISAGVNALGARGSLEARQEQALAAAREAKKKAAIEGRKIAVSENNTAIQAGFASNQAASALANDEQQQFDNQIKTRQADRQDKVANANISNEEAKIALGNRKLDLSSKGTKDSNKEGKDIRKRTIPGVGVALTEDDAKKGKAVVEKVNEALSTIKNLQNLRNDFGSEVFNREAVATGKSRATQVQLLVKSKEFAELGVLTGPDLELLTAIIPSDPLQLDVTGATEAKLKEAEAFLTGKANAFFEARGLKSPFAKHPRAGQRVRVNGKQYTVADDGELVE